MSICKIRQEKKRLQQSKGKFIFSVTLKEIELRLRRRKEVPKTCQQVPAEQKRSLWYSKDQIFLELLYNTGLHDSDSTNISLINDLSKNHKSG